MLNRKIEPSYSNATDFQLHLPLCEKYTLDNGVPVYLLNGGVEEVASIELVFDAGNWYDSKPLVSGAANFMLKSGTQSRSSYQLSEAFEFEGAYVNYGCQNETASISLHCLSRQLSKLLPIMAEQITETIFPQSELDLYKANALQTLSVNLKKGDFIANRLIDKYIYGHNHPYGIYYNKEDYEAITREDLLDFFQKYYLNGSCRIFVAGKLDKDIVTEINNVFGKLPIRFKPDMEQQMQHIIRPSTELQHEVINDADSVQAAIRVGRPFINRTHPDYADLSLLNTIFGGYFGSRLMGNIREEKGFTYGIYSYFQMHKKDTAWIISTEVKRDTKEQTLEEIWKEANLLKTELVDEEELCLVKNFVIGSILPELDGPFQVIGRWKSYILNGLDEQHFYKNIDAFKNVTAERIMELANQYLKEEDFYQLSVI